MNFLSVAMDAAVRAGGAILHIYGRDFGVELKADQSPLTEADKAAHHIILDALADTGLPVLSEESRTVPYAERKQWTRFWLVDPLDGTKEFISRNGEFTVNIALIKNGRPVLGVVYAPVLQTVYYGVQTEAGGRKTENGARKATDCGGKTISEILSSAVALPLQSAGVNRPSPIRVVASRSHCNPETEAFIADLEKTHGAVERVSSGSSLKFCMVAEGAADIYPRIAPTMEWDTAAAQAVVEAAGGRVMQYDPSAATSDYLKPGAGFRELRYNKENLLNPFFAAALAR